jgi:hypothetical protein
MAGILKVDTIQNANADNIITQTNSTTLTIGTSGDTVTLAAGATSSGFGATYNGAVNWDTTPKTTTVTAVSGNGYFINTTAGGVTVNLPAGSAGSIVALSDYAATWNTNNVTVSPNGTNKIGGINSNTILSTQGQAVTLIYVDSTQGWTNVGDATKVTGLPPFVAATGGTITTCGDYKIHSFTGPGTFTVTSAGTPAGSNSVDYLVLAGGGGGGSRTCSGGTPSAAGGGAGGYRFSNGTASGSYSAGPAPLGASALPVSVTAYPITVGAGGASRGSPGGNGNPGNPSIFSTITSTGGGGGGGDGDNPAGPPPTSGGSGGGGSGGGGGIPGGSGNTPPVSPPQGNPGFNSTNSTNGGGGGGASTGGPGTGINGAAGLASSITATSVTRAGGGGAQLNGTGGPGGGGAGATSPTGTGSPGTINTGGGAGGGGLNGSGGGGSGGSGIVVIRYKFQ